MRLGFPLISTLPNVALNWQNYQCGERTDDLCVKLDDSFVISLGIPWIKGKGICAFIFSRVYYIEKLY